MQAPQASQWSFEDRNKSSHNTKSSLKPFSGYQGAFLLPYKTFLKRMVWKATRNVNRLSKREGTNPLQKAGLNFRIRPFRGMSIHQADLFDFHGWKRTEFQDFSGEQHSEAFLSILLYRINTYRRQRVFLCSCFLP